MTASERVGGTLAEEQAALRRVATLVAHDVRAGDLFAAVAREVGTLMDGDTAAVVRFEPDGTATMMGGHHARRRPGERFVPDEGYVVASVLRTGVAARFDADAPASTDMPDPVRQEGICSAVASPIVVDGRLWGTVTVASLHRSLPAAAERRLGDFTELVATAIANADARAEVGRLALEHAALRRVATLVAQDVPSGELFDAVAREVGTLLGGDFAGLARFEDGFAYPMGMWAGEGDHPAVPPRWPTQTGDPATTIEQAAAPTRWVDWSDVPGPIAAFFREMGVRSSVGTPIVVEGRLWGALALHSKRSGPFPPDTESRMQEFTDLVGTAIANAQARGDLSELAQEQTALRRVATLVAQGTSPERVFRAVADQVAELLGCDESVIVRFEGAATAIVLAGGGGRDVPGDRRELDPAFVTGQVRRTGRSARFDTDDPAGAGMPELVRELGIRSAVASPVVVEGELWGAVTVASRDRRLPAAAERRLTAFTELVATAVANTQARAQVSTLADEQAALRRVATLVAKERSLPEVFAGVAEEASRALGLMDCRLWRDEGDGTATLVAVAGSRLGSAHGVGMRRATGGDSTIGRAMREGRTSRVDDYAAAEGPSAALALSLGLGASLACPIFVGERGWGAMQVVSHEAPIPLEVETRIVRFSDLVATAIANTEARAEVARLAEEQAALRRVATLVAQGAEAGAVFDTVAAEIKRLLVADHVVVCRYEPGDELTVLARRAPDGEEAATGMRVSHEGDSVEAVVRRTERPARIGSFEGARGLIAEWARSVGVGVAVGTPIVVDGRLWGVVSAGWSGDESPPGDTEQRMAQFGQLVDTAIANADSRDQLTASRARLMTAGDEARRRVVRDLHDGAQQRLVHAIVTLKLAQRALRENDGQAESLLGEALSHAEYGNEELRELAHGILPSVLTHGGLRAGVRSLAGRLDVPVRVRVPGDRFPAEVEASAYFIVAEALTNVVKHAQAGGAEVSAAVEDGMLRVEVRDDGQGGADPGGTGLVGMSDRAAALGGRLEIESPPGAGTRVTASIPLGAAE